MATTDASTDTDPTSPTTEDRGDDMSTGVATAASGNDSGTDDDAVCGNGRVEQDEACDDGINDGSYGGCMRGCSELGPRCGDAIAQGDEMCDDGDQTNGNGCNVDCVESGSTRWLKVVDGISQIRSVAVLPDDAIIALGYVDSHAWLSRYTADGNEEWTTAYEVPGTDQTYPNAIATDASGDIYAAGYYRLSTTGDQGSWVRKYTSSGGTGYLHMFEGGGDASYDAINGIAVDDDGFAVVAGQSDLDDLDIWIRRLGPDGSEFWTRSYDLDSSDYAVGAAIDSNGDIIVIGGVLDKTENIWVRKYNSDGGTLWTEVEVGDPGAFPGAVAVDSLDRIILAGDTNGDVWVQQRDANGDIIWTDVSIPDGGNAQITSVAVDADDNVIVAGFITEDYWRMWVRKYTADGAALWTHEGQVGMPENFGSTIAWSVAIDSEQNVIIGGREALDDVYHYSWLWKVAP